MARLVSVNVGLPRDVPWHDQTVHTGAWKQPVTGPRMVRRLNVDGDGQGDLGGHGGENRAVLVYQLDSYRHWAAEFGRDDLVPGILGENFTVEGLPDDEVCIGDRYRIGDAVFEVTQPRVTCYRAGMRIGEPRMAALLVAHGRPGFYCRVITEGEVEAGQDIVKVAAGPEGVSVADVDALLYLPGDRHDVLERALRIPALSPGWQSSLKSLASGDNGLTASAPPPAWAGFRPFRVTGLHDESRDVRSFSLTSADGTPPPEWRAGQSIALRLRVGGTSVIRNYSLSNGSGADHYRISVKREAHGVASAYLHAHVAEGDLIDVAAPRGTFFLAGGAAPVILLSAGVGVTPVLSMLRELAAAESTRPVWWLYAARNGAQHPLAGEAAELLKRLSHSHSRICYSQPLPTDHVTDSGRLSLAGLELPLDANAYLCGPVAFMDEFSAALVAHGLDPARIHSERFGAIAALTPGIAARASAPHLPAGPPGPGPGVQFARSGLTASWGPPSVSLLEFAEACDVPARWSCRTGVCHNCETALLSGSVRYAPEPLELPAEGIILICCAQPVEDVVIDL
jgi:ferredoxin-NADP reductase/MOSC domain-containing protein YiiM